MGVWIEDYLGSHAPCWPSSKTSSVLDLIFDPDRTLPALRPRLDQHPRPSLLGCHTPVRGHLPLWEPSVTLTEST